MRQYPLYIFDLDGTVYRGSEALPTAAATLAELRRRGALVRFLTNNSSQTPAVQVDKLSGMGIEARPEEVLTSAVGTARYLRKHELLRVFVVGEPGLIDVLKSHGIRSIGGREECDAVVAGICRSFTYDLMNDALQQLLKGVPFVATNADATYPLEGGRLVPGAGAIVSAIQTCSGITPVVIGKPDPMLVRMVLDETGIAPSDALVVGDRYETDIVSGQAAGCDTLLVLTGVTRTPPRGQESATTLRALL